MIIYHFTMPYSILFTIYMYRCVRLRACMQSVRVGVRVCMCVSVHMIFYFFFYFNSHTYIELGQKHNALQIDRTSLFPGLEQLWLSLGLSLLLVPPCGIVSCRPLGIPSSLLICPPLQLFLKPVCFLGATCNCNKKSASVRLYAVRSAIQMFEYNTIQ